MANAVNWQQFGLKKNPYDTHPLVEGGDLSMEEAFVGRDKERTFIDNILEAEERLCLTVCGDVGVGKTSLVNFQKFIWKYQRSKLLFSTRREIEANIRLLDKKNFIIEIISSILQEIKLRDENLLKDKLLKKLTYLVGISHTLDLSLGVSIMGNGGNISRAKDVIEPLEISISMLEGYFGELLEFITSNEIGGLKYSGLLIHVNNFDVVLDNPEDRKQVIRFFHELRDFFQTPKIYFIFLGPRDFYRDIIATQKRVKSIFYQTPLQIRSLTKKEIVEAFDRRMHLLQSEDVSRYIKPVEDAVIFQLYDLYEGDIRSVMEAVRDIIGQLESAGRPLKVDESMVILGRLRWEEIQNAIDLTEGQLKVLRVIIQSRVYISQKQAAQMLHKPASNIAQYYFKPLKVNNIIEENDIRGKEVFYGLTSKYLPLKKFVDSQRKLIISAKRKGQMKLFVN